MKKTYSRILTLLIALSLIFTGAPSLGEEIEPEIVESIDETPVQAAEAVEEETPAEPVTSASEETEEPAASEPEAESNDGSAAEEAEPSDGTPADALTSEPEAESIPDAAATEEEAVAEETAETAEALPENGEAIPENGEAPAESETVSEAAEESADTTEEAVMVEAIGEEHAEPEENLSVEAAAVEPSIAPEQASVTIATKQTVSVAGWKATPSGSASSATYTSSKPKVAAVDANGLVTAKKAGTAQITITADNGKTCTVEIIVKKAPSKIRLKVPTKKIGVGETMQSTYTITKNSLTTIRYTSSNPAVATVDENGLITAVGRGKCKITVITHNNKKSSVKLTVQSGPTEAKFSVSSITMGKGDRYKPSVSFGKADVIRAQFSSSNPAVAVVDASKGTIGAVGLGSCVISVDTFNGFHGELNVTVVPSPESIELTAPFTELAVGETMQLTKTVKPAGANGVTTFKSSKSRVLSVDENGKVTAKRTGTAVITAKCYNGVTAKIKIIVRKAPTSISIASTRTVVGVGEQLRITAKMNKKAGGTYTVTSSDDSVLPVSGEGTVTAKAPGTATVTATTFNGKTDSITITVKPAPTGVWIKEVSAGIGSKVEAQAGVNTGSAGTLTYSVANPKIATVDPETGMVSANGVGATTITAKAYNGVSATATLTVKPVPTYIKFPTTNVYVAAGASIQLAPEYDPGAETTLVYKSKKPSIATVSEDGVVTGVKVGKTIVAVQTHNKKTAKVTVNVLKAPSYVKLSTTQLRLKVGASWQLTGSIGDDVTAKLTFETSNSSVATVDQMGGVKAVGVGMAVITVRTDNGLSDTCSVAVYDESTATDFDNARADRVLEIPERRTNVDEIDENLMKIAAIQKSAYSELDELYANKSISKKEYDARKDIVDRAFAMYAFPWMTDSVQKYWKEANSDGGAKDYKPGIVYYGMPYTQTNRTYDVTKALKEQQFVLSADQLYYKLNKSKQKNGTYAGSDCSSFVSMAIFGGSSSSHASDNTRAIAKSTSYKTLPNDAELHPGDVLNRSGRHVVMFLYYADTAKTKMVYIEQGGSEFGINTCSVNIQDVDYYTSDNYVIRRPVSMK